MIALVDGLERYDNVSVYGKGSIVCLLTFKVRILISMHKIFYTR